LVVDPGDGDDPDGEVDEVVDGRVADGGNHPARIGDRRGRKRESGTENDVLKYNSPEHPYLRYILYVESRINIRLPNAWPLATC
jgi:hypothetical protein